MAETFQQRKTVKNHLNNGLIKYNFEHVISEDIPEVVSNLEEKKFKSNYKKYIRSSLLNSDKLQPLHFSGKPTLKANKSTNNSEVYPSQRNDWNNWNIKPNSSLAICYRKLPNNFWVGYLIIIF